MPRTPNPRRANEKKPKDARLPRLKQADPGGKAAADGLRGEALSLKQQKLSYAAIAERLGVSKTTAFKYVNDGWNQLLEENDEKRKLLRAMEDENLDHMEALLEPVIRCSHLTILDEQLGLNGPVEVRLAPLEVQFKAIDRWLKVGKRRGEIWGYDAPTKIEDSRPASALIPIEELKARVAEQKARQAGEGAKQPPGKADKPG